MHFKDALKAVKPRPMGALTQVEDIIRLVQTMKEYRGLAVVKAVL